MKLNSYRLVQRKFALGVPIPASTSSVAPPPAERKADPPHPPRSVYHNNMPAKNLLDVVAMQNIHKHKQPMVLLERLREDEIPAPPAPPKIRVPPRKRRNGLRVDKNNMCLRSGKRKSPEAGKGSVKKRRKLLSESTDDIPLVYFSRPNDGKAQSQANKAKDRSATKAKVKRFPPPKRGVRLETVTRRGSDRSAKNSSTDCNEDSSFTFKEPTSRARSYRILKRTTRTNPVVAARPLRKLDSRRSGLRSSTPVAKGIVRRLRDKRHSEKKLPKPVLSIVIEKPVVKEERAPSLCKENQPSLCKEHPPSLREEHTPPLREEHPPSLRKEHPPSLRKENPPSLREEHPPSIRKEHPPSLRKEHPPSLRKEHQPSLRKENPPSLREEHPPSIRKEHPPSLRKEHPPSLRKEHQPSLREKHPPSLREEHPPSIRKEHPPSLRKEHPPSLRKEHPPSLREKHPPSLREEHPPSLREDHPPSLREEHPPSLLNELPPSLLKELPSAPQPGTSSSSWPPLARPTPPASESGSSLRESLRLSPAGPSLLESPASDATNAEDSKFRVSVMNSIVEIPSPCTLACFDPKNSAKCDGCRQNKLESNEDWCINTSEVPEPSEGTTEAEKHTEQPANTQHETNQQHNEATNDTLPREEYSMLINTHEDSVLQLRAIVSALGCTTVPQDSSPENKHGPPERAEKDLEKNKGENRAADNNKVGAKNKVGKKNKVGEKRISEAQKKVENGPKQKKARKPATKSVAGPKKAKRGSKTSTQDTSNSVSTTVSEAQPPPVPANPDVYEFNAELETTRPPSGLRGRLRPRKPPSTSNQTTEHPEPQANLDTSQLDKDALLKVFGDKTHRIHITPKKPEEVGPGCLSVSIVRKETCSQTDAETTQSLVEKFLSSLSIQIQNELENFIVSERAQNTTANEPQPSTSRQANQARSNTNQSVNNADDQVASTSRQEPANETIKIESGVATYECPSTYLDQKTGLVMDAPTFYPTADEFADPIKYYDKIAPLASAFGLCKIVPPEGFKPPCNMSETTRFAVMYQYISKMYNRWGPVSRELAAIKAHLRSQSVLFARSPLLDGSEVNLPRLYHAVERFGGLTNVMRRNRWGRVAEEMKLSKLQYPERKLDPIYMRYLLPYATLSDQERQKLMAQVESCWTTKYQKMLDRARNPFQRQHRMLGTECESESDDENFDRNTTGALFEAEDCIVQGRNMNLATFKKIATSLMDAHFEPSKQPPSPEEVEKAYWRAVFLGTEHIVANTASVDTGDEGYGFPIDPEDEYGTHPWNLKFLARNPENVLRYLGRVLGVTVPTLHVSMVFSTSCWHRDPHGLPWTEYMHSGAEKIWYGIPRGESSNFRRAVETLCPAYCQNKSIWLASEITMVPPNILSAHGVKLSRLLQKPGEYVLVFPEAHTCSISTGVSISESVYFASNVWLSSVYKLFQELRNSCEPTMFSLEQLLLNGSQDPAAPQLVASVLATLLGSELEHRRALEARGVRVQERPPVNTPLNTSYFRTWDARDQDECEYCRSPLYLSKVTGFTGKKSAVCPEHAIRLLETKKHRHVDVSTLEIVSSHSTAALEEMLEWLETKNGPETRDSNVSPDQCIDLTGPDPPK